MPESLFNKVAGLGPATLIKKGLWHRRFPVNFAKFLRTPSLKKTSGLLLLPYVRTVYALCFGDSVSKIKDTDTITV